MQANNDVKLTPEIISTKILVIRDQKVILDRDLAQLYGVETRILKRAVSRNISRFPKDFMFELVDQEIDHVVSHFGIPSKSMFGGSSPMVFTEHGVLMLSSVLRSEKAISVNIEIMRVFTKMRIMLSNFEQLKEKIESLEEKYDKQFASVFEAIKELMFYEEESNKTKIGFRVD